MKALECFFSRKIIFDCGNNTAPDRRYRTNSSMGSCWFFTHHVSQHANRPSKKFNRIERIETSENENSFKMSHYLINLMRTGATILINVCAKKFWLKNSNWMVGMCFLDTNLNDENMLETWQNYLEKRTVEHLFVLRVCKVVVGYLLPKQRKVSQLKSFTATYF